MCGIFAYISKGDYDINFLREQGQKCVHRGPDNTKETIYQSLHYNIFFQFHRLSINGLTDTSNQPFELDHSSLMCNGEIYNYKELARKYNIKLETESDCEIILHLYHLLGIQMISLLDGVFSFIILDSNQNMIHIGHDPIGIRSLYMCNTDKHFIIASEMKCLTGFKDDIQMVKPGTITSYDLFTNSSMSQIYFHLEFPITYTNDKNSIEMIKETLYQSVKKRLLSDRPVGSLLSGGLDSSIIVSLMCKMIKPSLIKTFSIGLKGSPDLEAAEQVAHHLGTNHTSVIVSELEMLEAIEPTIQQIESYDTTTVRASVPMYLLSKYIKGHTDITVILSGEGSDELSGSYLYFHKAPSPQSFQDECIRLIKDVQHFDVLRGDKTTSGNSLEIRVPFFDKQFVTEYMSIDPKLKVVRNGFEKYLLRKAFEDELPTNIVWRRKEGFSDGVSSNDRPWYQVIDNYTKKHFNCIEKEYYLKVFTKYYKGYESLCPYEWLPNWVEQNNPSNRLIL